MQCTVDLEGVGIEKLHTVAFAVAPAMVHSFGFGIPKMFLGEGIVGLGGLKVFLFIEHGSGTGDGAQHEAVPTGKDFIIQMRAHALGADRIHLLTSAGEKRLLGIG